jgi:hypothetical protein
MVNRRKLGANRLRPQTASLTAVAILPLWLKQHTLLKSLQMHEASIDIKPPPDSI